MADYNRSGADRPTTRGDLSESSIYDRDGVTEPATPAKTNIDLAVVSGEQLIGDTEGIEFVSPGNDPVMTFKYDINEEDRIEIWGDFVRFLNISEVRKTIAINGDRIGFSLGESYTSISLEPAGGAYHPDLNSIVLPDPVVTQHDVIALRGIILYESFNGTYWRITVDSQGSLSTERVFND